MAVLRLTNGSDVTIRLTVEEAKTALAAISDEGDFVELPGDDGAIHVRPAHVVAILDHQNARSAGFRAAR